MARRIRKSIADVQRWNQMVNCLRLMNFSFNNVRLYPATHPEVVGVVTKLQETLTPILEESEDVGFGFMDEMLYLEGAMSIEETANNQMLVDRFNKCRVKYLTFMKGLKLEHLLAFFQILNAEATKPSDEHPDELLEKQGLSTIHIVEADLDDSASKSKMLRKKTLLDWYEKAVNSLTTVQEQLSKGEKTDLKSLFRVIDDMMATVRTKGYEPFLLLPYLNRGMEPHACHSVNVGILSCVLGELYGLNTGQINLLCICALLHDIGRISIPKEWIGRTQALSQEEKAAVDNHGDCGFLWLMKNQDVLPHVALLSALHHGDQNGAGQNGNYLPDVYHQIISVADSYDLASAGPKYYWKKQKPDKFIKKMLNHKGDSFDPTLLKLLVNGLGYYPVGSLVQLSDGQRGIVVRPNSGHLARPKVFLFEAEPPPVPVIPTNDPTQPAPKPVESEEPPPVIVDLSLTDPLVTRFTLSVAKVLQADPQTDLFQILDKKKEYLLSHSI